MLTPFDASTKFHVVTHVGKGLVLGVSHVFTARGRVRYRALPNFGDFFLFLRIAYHLSQNHNIWRGNTCRPVSRGHSRLSPQESWVPALPNFGVLLYLCLHPL